MISSGSEYSSELKEILEKRRSLENTVDKYVKLFPSKVIEYQDKYQCSVEETSYVLYTSDYIITSTELKDVLEEERVDLLFESMLCGKINGRVEIQTQLTLIELCQQLTLAIIRHFNYQRDRGFPISVIKSQIISSWLRDFFEMLSEYMPDIDIRWILAEIEGSRNGQYAQERYLEITKQLNNDQLLVQNYYEAAEYLVNSLNFKFTEEDKQTISTTAYDTQIQNSFALLSVSMEKEIWLGTTFTTTFKLENITSILNDLLTSLPSIKTENGFADLRFYHSIIRKLPMGTGKKIFLSTEKNDTIQITLIIFSSGIEDINYTSIRAMLRKYIFDIDYLINKGLEKKIEVLSSWAERILVSQTVEGSEVFGQPNDIDRERQWILESVVNASNLRKQENCEILARALNHDLIKNNIQEIINVNGILHELFNAVETNISHSFEILPYEAFYEGKDFEDCVLSLYQQENSKLSLLNMQSLFKTSDKLVHRKKHVVKRKYSRLKIRELVNRSIEDLTAWAQKSMLFKDHGYNFSNAIDTIDLVEKLAGKEIEKTKIISEVSVSDRLKELERKKDIQLQIQRIIFQYLTESLQSHLKISILNDAKLDEFLNLSVKNQVINEERIKLEDILDKYQIRKLPGNYGKRLMEIVSTIDNYFARSLSDGLRKLYELEHDLGKSDTSDLIELLQIIRANFELKA